MRSNPTDPEAAKKAYALAQASQVLDINDFAEHIITHGCVYAKGDLVGILTMTVDCIKEQLLAGNAVQLGDLGKFYLTLKSKGATSLEDFSASNIKKVNPKWAPGSNFKNLKNEATFELKLTKKAEAAAKKEAYK